MRSSVAERTKHVIAAVTRSRATRVGLLSTTVALGMLATPLSEARASHGQAVVSGIAGTGFGLFPGNYTHESGPNGAHPWYSFFLVAGQQVDIALTTNFPGGSYLWLYGVLDNNVEVGDTPGVDIMLVATSSNTDAAPGPFQDQNITYFAGTTGQYVVQVDSWVGGSGAFELSIAAVNVVPEPASVALVAFGLIGLGVARRRVKR